MSQLLEQIEHLTQPVLDELGLELVDLEYQRGQGGWTLRFYLDKEGGITLDDCAVASREISTLLDVEDLIKTSFNLEVSSPGIERPLKRLADFERFSGRLAKIKTTVAIDPDGCGRQRKTFAGILGGADGTQVLLTIKNKSATQIRIDFELIDSAHLEFEF